MFKLKDKIFSLFTQWDKRVDINKDSNDKGTVERYNEILGDQLDVDIIPFINDMIDNTLVPSKVLNKFIPYLESMVGLNPITDDIIIRRELLKNIINIYKVKGTNRSYEILFKVLGFDTVDIVEADISFGLDSPLTFDDDTRVFDLSECYRCGFYSLNLTGSAPLTAELKKIIAIAVKLVEPINAQLLEITYNGDAVDIISIFVDERGDLIFETENDITLLLDAKGELIISGASASKYSIDANGNMIYND